MCLAVDIALSLSQVWVVVPYVLCAREVLLAIIQRRELKDHRTTPGDAMNAVRTDARYGKCLCRMPS